MFDLVWCKLFDWHRWMSKFVPCYDDLGHLEYEYCIVCGARKPRKPSVVVRG